MDVLCTLKLPGGPCVPSRGTPGGWFCGETVLDGCSPMGGTWPALAVPHRARPVLDTHPVLHPAPDIPPCWTHSVLDVSRNERPAPDVPPFGVHPAPDVPPCCWVWPVAAVPREEHPTLNVFPAGHVCWTCPVPDLSLEAPSQTSRGGSSLAAGASAKHPAGPSPEPVSQTW